MNTMRSTFYDALRATPVYPRREAGLFLLVAVVAITYGIWGWPAIVVAFALTALRALRSADGIGEAIIPLLVVTGLAAGSIWVLVQHSAWLLFLLAVLASLALLAWWLLTEVSPTFTTRSLIARRGDREQRAGGVASKWDIGERASRKALLLRAEVLRPSLAGVPRRQVDPWQVGSLVATQAGVRGARRLTRHIREVWSAVEDTTLRVGGPRTYKTVALAVTGIKAPGALVTTSTRLDLAQWMHDARMGRPVHIFNPTGYGAVPSTVRWSILVGCEDYATAARRAADLIPESPSTEGERWDRMARQLLPVLLHAAAVGERGVEQVSRWVRDIADATGKERTRREIIDILAADPTADQRVGLLQEFLAYPEKTRGSVTAMVTPALAWVSDNVARAIGAAPIGAITLDIPKLILNQETLHILGADQSGGMMAPLTSALVAEVAHQGRMIASTMPGERLDPPMTMCLDEIGVAVHLPLPQWSADFGGRGITVHMAAQSLSQLRERWGDDGAGILLGNTGTLLLYGGGKDAQELDKVSVLCGERYREIVGGPGEDFDGDGKKWDKVRVLTPAQLMNMPPGVAAILQRGLGGLFVGRPPTTLDLGVTKRSLTDDPREIVGDVVSETTEDARLTLVPAPRPEAVA